jgi:hypothetical protein
VRQRRRRKSYPDVHEAGDSQIINCEPGGTSQALGRYRHLKNLENAPQLRDWASKHGFEFFMKNHDEHWILKGANVTAEWWPRTAKLVLNYSYLNGIQTHDWMQSCTILDDVRLLGKWNSVSFSEGSSQDQKHPSKSVSEGETQS